MGKKPSQPICPTCERVAIIDDAGNVAFHTRPDGSFYCNPVTERQPTPPSPSPTKQAMRKRVVRCTRCGDPIERGRTCGECLKKVRAAENDLAASSSHSRRPKNRLVASPRVPTDPSRSWILERARDALMAGFGVRRDRANIRELRSMVPKLVSDFRADLPASQVTMLRVDLKARGFTGKGALTKFGQTVVDDISRQRQGSFRGVTSGGLPGTRR